MCPRDTAGDWLRLYGRLWAGCVAGFFASRKPLASKRLLVMALFVPAFLAIQSLHWIGFLLDEVLFPGYRRVAVRQPVFIIGIPRSGTTLLHRVLARDTGRFTTFSLWELLFAPSVTERKLWMGLAQLDGWIGSPLRRLAGLVQGPVFRRLEAVHQVSLDDPEEDYLTLLPVFACFLLVLAFPSSESVWKLSRFDVELRPDEQRRILAFYRCCLQRHLFVHGPDKTLLSKNPSFSSMVLALDGAFPDCRIICTVRSPMSTVPSLLSSMKDGLLLFNSQQQWDDFRPRLIRMLSHYYEHVAVSMSAWPDERRVYLDMRQLSGDLCGTVEGLYDRLGWALDPAFAQQLAAAGEESRRYRSAHKYDLEAFGLNAQFIREEFAHAFDRFQFASDSRAGRCTAETVRSG